MSKFEVKATFKTSPEELYDAWLDGEAHADMTGAAATGEPRVGASFTAWDGYISGTNLELRPGERIVQAWRTTEFPEGAPDSRVEITLTATATGTQLRLVHSEIPAGQADNYKQGWKDYYFAPMKEHFSA